jgi:transposase InsO family protein
VAAGTGELLGEQTVPVGRRGFGALLQWARGLNEDHVWALEDCRHVSGSSSRAARGVRRAELRTEVFEYIEIFFNRRRRHSTLGFVSPAQFERTRQIETEKIELRPTVAA